MSDISAVKLRDALTSLLQLQVMIAVADSIELVKLGLITREGAYRRLNNLASVVGAAGLPSQQMAEDVTRAFEEQARQVLRVSL